MRIRLPIRSHRARARLNSRLGLTCLEDRLTPSFAAPVSYAAGSNTGTLASADFNHDGKIDLVSGGDSVRVQIGNGNGSFLAGWNAAAPEHIVQLANGDFNNDGNVDILAAPDVGLYVYHGNGDGTFQAPIHTADGQVVLTSIAVVDLNHDGNLDVVQSGWYVESEYFVVTLLGNGNGTFAIVGVYSAQFANLIQVGDFDEDSNPDVVTLWNVFHGNGDGTLTQVGSFDDWPSAVGDFNNDTHLDLAGTGGVYLGDGNGGFSPVQSVGIGFVSAAGNLNGDSALDLVSAGSSLSVHLGDGNGTFGSTQEFAAGSSFNDLVLGDFNNDGFSDAATVDASNVNVFVNDGNWVQMPTVSITDASVTEGNSGTTSMTFTLTLSDAQSQPVSVQFSTANGTATAGSDYVAANGTVTFAPGETSKNVTITLLGDTTPESNETLPVNLHDPVGLAISGSSAIGIILNDDFTIAINDITLTEGNTGTQSANFTVTLSGASTQAVTVQFLTANGTATSSDFQSTGGTLSFSPGQTSKTVIVPVKGDRLPEPTETFFVNLSNPTNATIADSQGVGTILDNEPRVSINDVSMTEGHNGTKNFVFTVTLSVAYDQAVTMSFRTVNGTATTANNDYVANNGTLTFSAGQTSKTITIQVKGDKKNEPNETFNVELFNLSSNASFTDNWGLGTILNDD